MKRPYAVAALALVLAGNAWAHDEQEGGSRTKKMDVSWYAGGSVAQNTFKDWSSAEAGDDGSYISRSVGDSDTGVQVFVGVDLGRYFAFEFGYANYGEATFLSQSDGSGSVWAAGPIAETIGLKSIGLDLLGKLPLGESVALFGKVGTFRWTSTFEGSGTLQCCGTFTFSEASGGSDGAYGAGLQFDGFRPARVVVEYTAANFGSSFFEPQHPKLESIVLSLAYVFSRE